MIKYFLLNIILNVIERNQPTMTSKFRFIFNPKVFIFQSEFNVNEIFIFRRLFTGYLMLRVSFQRVFDNSTTAAHAVSD